MHAVSVYQYNIMTTTNIAFHASQFDRRVNKNVCATCMNNLNLYNK